MITVYIWDWHDGLGHASMKITGPISTKYYSWWPAADAGLGNLRSPLRGKAKPSSSGYRHPRRNMVSYGPSKLDRAYDERHRGVTGGLHNPGGSYVYNKSDKGMEGEAADYKFYFRPSSGLRADLATQAWDRRVNAGLGKKGQYHLTKNSCSTTVIEALQAAVREVPRHGGESVPTSKKLIKDPEEVFDYCLALAQYLNKHKALWSPAPQTAPRAFLARRGPAPAPDLLPPVIGALNKAKTERFVDPLAETPVQFSKEARHEPHTT